MKQYKTIHLLGVLAVIFSAIVSPLATAADRAAFTAKNNPVASKRIIVKLKPVRLPSGLNSVQTAAELRKPFTSETLSKIQAAAGTDIFESHALSSGAHVLVLQGAPGKQAIAQAVSNIGKLFEVDYVEEDLILTAQAAPNDASYGTLWGMQPLSAVASPAPGASGNYGADFETAWDTFTGTGVVVAVLDTGITAHGDIGTVSPLTGNLISAGYDFITDCRVRNTCPATTLDAGAYIAPSTNASDLGDFISTADSTTAGSLFYGLPVKNSSWHGTHVSGTVAAIGNNSSGVVGGAYNARILPVRILGKGGGYVSDISEGMLWAAGIHPTVTNPNPARVLNLSLGGTGTCGITQQAVINAAVAAGTVVVVAAGNENAEVATASPANCDNVISVSAIARDGSRAVYSNYSSPASNVANPVQVTLAAQGGDTSLSPFDPGIYSTYNSGTTTVATATYAYKEGTSMATPHVAAAVALMFSRNSTLTPAQVKTILSANVTAFPSFSTAGWAPYDCATLKNCGAGILNANLALRGSLTPFTASAQSIDFGTVTSNAPVSRTVTLTNSSGASVTLGSAAIVGESATSFSITGNTCTGLIANAATCQVSVSFSAKFPNTNSGGLYIPAVPPTGGSIAVGLSGVASIPLNAATATAATSSSTGSASGGCSIMPAGSHPDLSVLLSMLIIIAYRFRQRLNFSFGKN